MKQNHKYYLIWPDEFVALPPANEALQHIERSRLLNSKAPHLLHLEKQIKHKQTLPLMTRLRKTKDYPFKNGQQPNTKGCIVWTDYAIYSWPLIIYLLKINPAISLDKVIDDCFKHNNPSEPQWDAILTLFSEQGSNTPIVETDELDRWYDEVSLTHLSPQSYHQLYKWFGADIKNIGYMAFDYYMQDRDGLKAWQQAIQQHLATMNNLPAEQAQVLYDTYLAPLLNLV